jgi:hypothetical protein
MKVSKLIGTKLDYWVAMAEGWEADPLRPAGEYQIRIKHALTYQASHLYSNDGYCYALCGADRPYSYSPSTNWVLAGVIIERERISVHANNSNTWNAGIPATRANGYEYWAHCQYSAPSLLVAAMRTFVMSKYGEEVPDAEE